MEAARGARLMFNDGLDATVTAAFMIATVLLLVRIGARVGPDRSPAGNRLSAKESPFVETAYAG